MHPGDGFWSGIGSAVAASPWWAVVGGVLVIGILVVVAKYIYPGHKELKLKELGIREREAQNDADRIKANAMLAESQRQTNVLIDGMRASLDASTARVDVIVSEIHGSRDGSKKMGTDVAHIKDTTDRTALLVEDLHREHFRREGTD